MPVSVQVDSHCDIAVRYVSSFTTADFLENFHGRRPVLIRGAAAEWPAQHRWTRPFLKQLLAQFVLEETEPRIQGLDAIMNRENSSPDHSHDYEVLSQRPYMFRRFLANGTVVRERHQSTSGVVAHETSFRVPVEDLDMTKYFDQWATDSHDVAVDQRLHDHSSDGGRRRTHDQFLALGGEGSGLKAHDHEAFWGGLIWGRKHWLLCPSGGCDGIDIMDMESMVTAEDLQRWLRGLSTEEYNKGKRKHGSGVLRCFQEKGDVLYAPAETMHGVWNIGECVSISHVYAPEGLRVT